MAITPGSAIPRRVKGLSVGQHIGRLTILSFEKLWYGVQRKTFVRCLCDCGTEKLLCPTRVRNRETKSCGCLRHDRPDLITHGDTAGRQITAEYRLYAAIKTRCTNPNCRAYRWYGGRGIKMCAAWMASYETFLAYVGRRPTPQHSLDRYPNRDGDYEPGNVRWATWREQAQNKDSAVMLTHNGVTQCLSEWSRATGVPIGRISARLRYGWPAQKALSLTRGRFGTPFVEAVENRANEFVGEEPKQEGMVW